MKVSFDFDSTLDRKDVQEYASELISRGVEVWIVTSRVENPMAFYGSEDARYLNWNDDLFSVASTLGIPKERIRFTAYQDKSEFLIPNNFTWHLDDDTQELFMIKRSKVRGIQVESNSWKNKCERILNSIK